MSPLRIGCSLECRGLRDSWCLLMASALQVVGELMTGARGWLAAASNRRPDVAVAGSEGDATDQAAAADAVRSKRRPSRPVAPWLR